MIELIIRSADGTAAEVLLKAFERSFTRGQVRYGDDPAGPDGTDVVAVLGATDADASWLESLTQRRAKVLLFGDMAPRVARLAGVSLHPIADRLAADCDCPPTTTHAASESAAALVYAENGLGASSPLRRRHFCRFDFTNEWNNLGYGKIAVGTDPWSLAVTARCAEATSVARIETRDGEDGGAVATLRELPDASILWFARPVGPVDGPDWRIVEAFVSDHRHETLPCRPYLRDIPHGVAAAVTMRLDCDEDIASARPLFELYRGRNIPFSVAVKTDQNPNEAHLLLLHDVVRSGGAILSHSDSHASNWGGSAAAAYAEASRSKAWLERHVAGLRVRYAVSPFHQNPIFVPDALARAGYHGFIGGTIANDPEYLLARGGAVPQGAAGFVSHSQSCMLHGDCLLRRGDPISVYKQAFRTAQRGGQFFGYLDHPFSQRYSYGWRDEPERQHIHCEFLDFMAAECGGSQEPLVFLSEEGCLDFMLAKADTSIVFDQVRATYSISRTHGGGWPLSVGIRGHVRAAADHVVHHSAYRSSHHGR